MAKGFMPKVVGCSAVICDCKICSRSYDSEEGMKPRKLKKQHAKKRSKLGTLVHGVFLRNKHPEVNWGKREGKEVW
jgi:hypothetical protein